MCVQADAVKDAEAWQALRLGVTVELQFEDGVARGLVGHIHEDGTASVTLTAGSSVGSTWDLSPSEHSFTVVEDDEMSGLAVVGAKRKRRDLLSPPSTPHDDVDEAAEGSPEGADAERLRRGPSPPQDKGKDKDKNSSSAARKKKGVDADTPKPFVKEKGVTSYRSCANEPVSSRKARLKRLEMEYMAVMDLSLSKDQDDLPGKTLMEHSFRSGLELETVGAEKTFAKFGPWVDRSVVVGGDDEVAETEQTGGRSGTVVGWRRPRDDSTP